MTEDASAASESQSPASPLPAAGGAVASAQWQSDAQGPVLVLSGDGRQLSTLPSPPDLPRQPGQTLRLDGRQLSHFDSRLAAALWGLSKRSGLPLDTATLPAGLRGILQLAGQTPSLANAPPVRSRRSRWLAQIGISWMMRYQRTRTTLSFIGEVLLALIKAMRGSTAMRAEDLAFQLHATGPASLPIVTLVSFLVGLIIAYMGAAQLQRLGAQSFMADLVTVGVVREIAALMTGIILAGRVGAAFAAQLGSMQANEETDALRAMGLNPVEHLVLPRVLAMALMAPLLTTFAATVGMAAGGLVAVGIFQVEPLDYLYRSSQSLTLTHAAIGLLKGTVYAVLVALAGCRQGLNAGRSAQAVGEATTAAVVQAIVWIVIAASALTIAFQRLGW
ncbi:ABC transporter permease [Paucibacter sp. APW11]|uniref:ABC transporter permease n=1 Tax=Roseateles aquae TaxID=3077235 RepID=A0ABU3P8B2_9BURK|nr:ABC transporter permease [Paucibacter sp. APW11]MDT8998808.1 ABC transporter permease [Paucibacter sp. APW11]